MTAAQRLQIHTLHCGGMSDRAIAKIVKLAHTTVARVLAQPAPAELLPPAPADLDDDDGAPDDDAPALDQARYLMKQAREGLRAANASGDAQLGQRQTRNAAFLANVLARLEGVERDTGGGFYLQAGDIAEANGALNDRLKALAERGAGTLRCADCNRALSVLWSGLGEPHSTPESAAPDAAI